MSSLIIVLTNKANRSKQITPVIEDITRKVSNVRFGSSLGTGFSACELDIAMPFTKTREWYERYLFYGINIYEADEPVWEGRIEAIRITDEGISLTCNGYWSNLADQRLYSFWADNRMDAWKTPIEGAGNISDEIGLTNLINRRGWISVERALWGFGHKRGLDYAEGERVAIYYRLPRVDNLSDKRIFQPNTIHSIQYQWDRSSPIPSGFTHRIWTAPYDKSTSWTEKDATSPVLDSPGVKTVNLAANGDVVQAVAFGYQIVSPGITDYPNDDGHERMIFTNVTIWAERDAARGQANENTARKIITDLLLGNSNVSVDSKGNQISDDALDIQDNDVEVIPAVFADESLHDIINKLVGYGIGVETNLVNNPSLEIDTAGWTDEAGGAITRDTTTAIKGSASAKVAIANAAGEGFIIKRRDTTRIPVTGDRHYTFSCWAKLDAGIAKAFLVTMRWYTSGDVEISASSTIAAIQTGTVFGRDVKLINSKSPSNAAKVQLELVTQSAGGAYNLWADGVMFQESERLEPYIDGNEIEGIWSGDAHKSTSLKLLPANYGVFGRRRLHIKPRDRENIRWVIPLSAITDNGLSLERTVEEFWVRVWSRFNESFTGLPSYTDVAQNILNQQLISDERDRTYDVGSALTEFAEAISRIALTDFSITRQRAEIEVKTYILNIFGVREPLWRIRAGDLMIVPDLIPLVVYGHKDINKNDKYNRLDNGTVFVVREVEYDSESDSATILPDLVSQGLESILAQATLLPSLSPRTSTPSPIPSGSGGLSGAGATF